MVRFEIFGTPSRTILRALCALGPLLSLAACGTVNVAPNAAPLAITPVTALAPSVAANTSTGACAESSAASRQCSASLHCAP
jgi:hypothetical protein